MEHKMETDGRKILNIHEHIIDQQFIGFSGLRH